MLYCISCMGRNNLLNIYTKYNYEGDEEIYSNMFKACFDIEFLPESDFHNICSDCVVKLRDAFNFKQQTINTIYIFNATRELNISIKDPVDEDPTQDLKVEYLDDTLWDESDIFDVTTLKKESLSDEENNLIDPSVANSVRSTNIKSHRKVVTIVKVKTKKVNPPNKKAHEAKAGRKKKKVYVPDKAPYVLRPGQTHCELCGERFIHTKTLKEHMNSHYPNWVCEECGKKFLRRRSLLKHHKSHKEGPFVCKTCNKEFNTYNTLNGHVYYKHNKFDPYICNVCKQRFKTFTQRLAHQKLEHNLQTKYECRYCDKKFYYSGERSSHMRKIHLRIKNFKCTVCSKCYNKSKDLNYHMAKAHGIGELKIYNCSICPAKLSRLSSLQQHLKIHDSKRRFHCSWCEANFTYKCSLKSHLVTHARRGIELKIVGDVAVLIDGAEQTKH